MMRCSSGSRRRLADDSTVRNVAEALLFGRICIFAMLVPLLVRLSLPRMAVLVSPSQPGGTRPDAEDVRRLVGYVARAQRVLWPVVRSGCLTRGVTLFYFLGRAGMDVSLCFGIADPTGHTRAHCWLVRDDEPFLEAVDPRGVYAETYRIGPRP